MDEKKLSILFSRYIAKFDVLTNSYYDESYKWVACQQFKDCWEPNRSDFADMLKKALGGIGNITDAGKMRPRKGVELFAEQEPDIVRDMFLALFADGDLKTRVDRFIGSSEALVRKYGNWSNEQTPSAVMAYLACWKPDEYFFFKPREAWKFARFVGFEDDWGAASSFKPGIYCRMCNQLIEAMRQCDELMQTNKSRFVKDGRKLWPDEALHILAYDLIFCSFSPKYN